MCLINWKQPWLKLAYIFVVIFLSSTVSNTASAAHEVFDQPILVIGSSLENGQLPADIFNGFTINFGSYLSLGDALIRSSDTNGYVINEAEASTNTFDRVSCFLDMTQCETTVLPGFATQFNTALGRVSVGSPEEPASFFLNARYVVIGTPNDCLHSAAFGIPQAETTPCTTSDFHGVVDRIKAIANQAISIGMTPVITTYVDYDNIDLALFAQGAGFLWVIDEAGYNELQAIHRSRLTAELPEALVVDAWKKFTDIGDGLHPTPQTTRKAANKITSAIKKHARKQSK